MDYVQLEMNFQPPFKSGDVVIINGWDNQHARDFSGCCGVVEYLSSTGEWLVSFPDVIAPHGLPWLLRYSQYQLTKTNKQRLALWQRKITD